MNGSSIIPSDELADARSSALKDFKTLVKAAARNAQSPARRAAFAELEQEMMNLEKRWAAKGLLAAAPVAA